jgi:dUTP pyrophosphatase
MLKNLNNSKRMFMKLKVKKLEDRAVLPKYQTLGAAGFDLHAIDTLSIPAGGTVKVRTGLAFEIPEGYELQVRPRSGLSAKSKIRVANAPGTVDHDFTGEVLVILDNIAQNQAESYKITQGDRIAQAVLKKVELAEIELVDELKKTERGSSGFGSTGE